MDHDHPCPPPTDYEFWFSRDEEGPYYPGGPDRMFAVEEALAQGEFEEWGPDDDSPDWRAGVHVIIARPQHVDLSKFFDVDRWITDLREDRMEEGYSNEFSECHPLDEINREDEKALQASVRNAIWHWQNRRRLPLKVYFLDTIGTSVYVVCPHPDITTGDSA